MNILKHFEKLREHFWKHFGRYFEYIYRNSENMMKKLGNVNILLFFTSEH